MSSDAAGTASAVVDLVCAQYPHVARRIGRHDHDGRLPAVAPRSGDLFTPLLTSVRRHLDNLPTTGDPELRADLDTCGRLLEFERFRVVDLNQPYLGPLDYAHEADVSGYLAGSYAPLAERVAALLRHLAGLPDYLARAEEVLRPSISAGERLYGISWGPAQAASIRGIAGQLAGVRPDFAQVLAPVAGAAAAACERYARAIAGRTPAPDLLGPESLAEMLRITEGIERPVAELIEEAEAEVAAVTAALHRAARRIGEATPPAAYARLLGHLPAGPVADSLRSIVERLRSFWTDRDVLPVQTYVPFELYGSHGAALAADVVFIFSPPLEAVRRPHRVHVPEPDLPRPGQPPAAAWSYLNEPTLEMLAVHELYAGHYLQMETASTGPSPVRTSLLWFAGFTEGWAHYAEELAIEQGLADGRPLVETAQLRFALESASRLLTYLSVQSGRWTFAQAGARTAEINGWSAERAGRDVVETVSNRTRAMYALGKLQIRRWRAAEAATGNKELHDFHARLMRCGCAPLSTVRRYLADAHPAALGADT
ncbi:DUF885 family protein [Plantactinospora sp. KBS50]|uniref:DUF885 family protein n=1 Tax=Plantactinospora sp. KBS50 TaxID=2024580 RepID=UPI0012FE6916|nr:DUF885 family protein [Plantactinospora sp. KBS50]